MHCWIYEYRIFFTILELTEERKLEAADVTTTGFRLTWSRLSGDTGSYVLEYSVVSDPKTRLQKTFFGDETSVVLSNLLPNTTYQVTLRPGSTDKSVQPETIYATTLPGERRIFLTHMFYYSCT